VRLTLATIVLFALAAPAAAEPVPEDKTLSPYFFVEGGDPAVDKLPLEKTGVTVVVAGVIADVTVHQIYKNDGARPINARYVFPASTRAAVHGLTMVVGDEVVKAKIKRREEARRDFEQAKREGKNATLLEQDRPNVFSMEVANVMPGERITVELRYTELLVPNEGVYELVYPTVVGPRYSNQPVAGAPAIDRFVASAYYTGAPRSAFEMTGTVSAGVPVQELNCPSHKLKTFWMPDGSRIDFELDPTESRGGDRDVVLRYKLAGAAIASGLMLYQGERQGQKEGYFLLMAQPPARVAPADIPPREYVFILDVSGSMYGFPLDTAKRVMTDLARGLRPVDRFNVILFSGASQLMAPVSIPATRENIAAAMQVIDAQQGGGGTELLPALEQALALPREPGSSRTFVVVTDGYIAAEAEALRLIQKNLGDANVFAFGIGSSVNRYLIEGVARAGAGEPFVVTGPEGADVAARDFRKYIESPVLTRVRVETQGFEVYDLEPAAVPDLLAERPIVVHGKFRGEPKGTIRISGVSGHGEWSHTIDVASVTPSEKHAALPYLWARTRIAALSDLAFGGESEELTEKVVELGLGYNLLTKYTSFIAVREKVVHDGVASDVAQPLPLPAGVSESALPVEQGDEPGLVLLAVCLAVIAAAAMSRPRRERA